jgi:hypothetical protein
MSIIKYERNKHSRLLILGEQFDLDDLLLCHFCLYSKAGVVQLLVDYLPGQYRYLMLWNNYEHHVIIGGRQNF